VRRRPYAVILFDEVEKAHGDVFNVLLQVRPRVLLWLLGLTLAALSCCGARAVRCARACAGAASRVPTV
jgi:hypothetical protein